MIGEFINVITGSCLQLSDYECLITTNSPIITLSDYNFVDLYLIYYWAKYSRLDAPVTFEELLIVMIEYFNPADRYYYAHKLSPLLFDF